jgi:hypothetical protein
VRGGEGQLGHAAGGGERGGARPAPVRGAGRTPGTWSAECWRTASRGCAAKVARTSFSSPSNYDALSFNLLEEGSLVFEDPQAAREMEAFFLEDLKHATEVHAQ